MQLSTSLRRIGSDLVNSFLIEDAGLITVVDTGLPGHWGELIDELEAMGRSLDDVRAVVLTHGDTDHVGFAERLRRERGIPIYVHELDAGRARREVSKPNTGWGSVRLRPLAGFLFYTARRGGLRIPRLAEVVSIADGTTLDVPGAPRVIAMPGHTPGSIALHAPTVDAVFVGDAMTTRNVLTGDVGPAMAPFTLDPDQARASLGRLDGLDARWVLPGHGAPWDAGLAEALSQVRATTARSGSAVDHDAWT